MAGWGRAAGRPAGRRRDHPAVAARHRPARRRAGRRVHLRRRSSPRPRRRRWRSPSGATLMASGVLRPGRAGPPARRDPPAWTAGSGGCACSPARCSPDTSPPGCRASRSPRWPPRRRWSPPSRCGRRCWPARPAGRSAARSGSGSWSPSSASRCSPAWTCRCPPARCSATCSPSSAARSPPRTSPSAAVRVRDADVSTTVVHDGLLLDLRAAAARGSASPPASSWAATTAGTWLKLVALTRRRPAARPLPGQRGAADHLADGGEPGDPVRGARRGISSPRSGWARCRR